MWFLIIWALSICSMPRKQHCEIVPRAQTETLINNRTYIQEDVQRIERQLLSLQGALGEAEVRNKILRQEINEASIKERKSVLESQIARSELLKLRQELMGVTDALEESKEETAQLKV